MKRNIVFLSMAFLSLACFIGACLGFGFQSSSQVLDLVDIKKIEDAKDAVNGIGVGTWYLKTSYGLIVSGLALTTVAILMGTMITYFQPTRTRLIKGISMWDQIFMTILVFISVALILTGEMFFMTQYLDKDGGGAKFSDFWKVGPMIGMIILTVIPLFLMIAPFFVKEEGRKGHKRHYRLGHRKAHKEHKAHKKAATTTHHKKTTHHKAHRGSGNDHHHTTTETETIIIA